MGSTGIVSGSGHYECAASSALQYKEVRRDGRTVDGNERTVFAMSEIVNRVGDQQQSFTIFKKGK
jgi:hypothetical protein